MTGYLVKRPIAVLTVTAAVLVLGLVAVFRLPTSLMPDIDIPEITVQISYPDHNARELENNVVKPLRQSLLQVNRLEDIQSETRDEFALIRLRFSYGTPVHYAFVETNEKIDASMQHLPRNLQRPKVIKASATDIPVMNLVVVPKGAGNKNFLQWSAFARNVLKKRLEQLPEVAIADMSGAALPQISIVPDPAKLEQTGITTDEITRSLKAHNIDPGNFIIRNGIYQYRFKLDNSLRSPQDIAGIPLMHGGKLYRLGDIAKVYREAQPPLGMVTYQGQPAIVFAVIKQSDAKISGLKEKIYQLTRQFRKDYPELEFRLVNDQARLLEISLSNLFYSLLLGMILAIGILYFFVRNFKIALIIGFSIPSSLIISMLILWLMGISINIISLSGLILGVGLMIDNAIIVIDNMVQKSSRMSLFEAVVEGAKEVAGPLVSSALTTVSVFVPLIFLSGLAGALFYDQAVSVSAGLLASVLVSLLLIPVLFYLLMKKSRIDLSAYRQGEEMYDRAYRYFFRNKKFIWITAVSGMLLLALAKVLPKEKFPAFTRSDTILKLRHNIPLDVKTRQSSIDSLIKRANGMEEYVAYIGKQDFLLQRAYIQDPTESQIYIRFNSPEKRKRFEDSLTASPPPHTTVSFHPPENVFQYMFGGNEPAKKWKIYSKQGIHLPEPDESLFLATELPGLELPVQESKVVKIDPEALLFFNVSYESLRHQLESVFQAYTVDRMKNEKEFVPIRLSYPVKDIFEQLNEMSIRNRNGKPVPLRNLIEIRPRLEWKKITADRKGEFLTYLPPEGKNEQLSGLISNRKKFFFVKDFSGRGKLLRELLSVLLISLVLLYLIMAAQFESLWQPLIILLEIPIDAGFALLFLALAGSSINIMSLIGLVVMSGIVVNDSILKIHTINLLLREGLDVDEAIHEAGKIRLKPILMTTFTTVLALLPVLFMKGMGAELQKPLALVITGGLLFGTFISLFFVPLMYKYFFQLFSKSLT